MLGLNETNEPLRLLETVNHLAGLRKGSVVVPRACLPGTIWKQDRIIVRSTLRSASGVTPRARICSLLFSLLCPCTRLPIHFPFDALKYSFRWDPGKVLSGTSRKVRALGSHVVAEHASKRLGRSRKGDMTEPIEHGVATVAQTGELGGTRHQ